MASGVIRCSAQEAVSVISFATGMLIIATSCLRELVDYLTAVTSFCSFGASFPSPAARIAHRRRVCAVQNRRGTGFYYEGGLARKTADEDGARDSLHRAVTVPCESRDT